MHYAVTDLYLCFLLAEHRSFWSVLTVWVCALWSGIHELKLKGATVAEATVSLHCWTGHQQVIFKAKNQIFCLCCVWTHLFCSSLKVLMGDSYVSCSRLVLCGFLFFTSHRMDTPSQPPTDQQRGCTEPKKLQDRACDGRLFSSIHVSSKWSCRCAACVSGRIYFKSIQIKAWLINTLSQLTFYCTSPPLYMSNLTSTTCCMLMVL